MAAPLTAEEAAWLGAPQPQRDLVVAQLLALLAPAHLAHALKSALPGADPDAAPALADLAAVLCSLLCDSPPTSATSHAAHPSTRAAPALNALAFSAHTVARLWSAARAAEHAWGQPFGGSLLTLFAAAFSQLLVVLSDDEFLGLFGAGPPNASAQPGASPFAEADLVPICQSVKSAALLLLRAQPAAAGGAGSAEARDNALLCHRFAVVSRLLGQLHDCDVRRRFTRDDGAWYADAARLPALEALLPRIEPHMLGPDGAAPPAPGADGRELAEVRRLGLLLHHAPFMLPFEHRLALLHRWLSSARDEAYVAQLAAHGHAPPHAHAIHRETLLEDGYASLRRLGPAWRLPLHVQFFNLEGVEEAGVGPGVSREFITDALFAIFAPSLGLFRSSGDGSLFPNPAAHVAVPDAIGLFEFAGSLLAKALYESILVELPLAPFFLNHLAGRTNTINDLPALDPTLARSLAFLKAYDGDVEDLCLTFAVDQFAADEAPPARRRVVELRRGGAEMAVTRANRVEYIFLVAHYRLNSQMRRASDAFVRGFESAVPRAWVSIFSHSELQLLLGGSDAPLDVDDWRAHTVYAGGYHAEHAVVRMFWRVLAESTPTLRAATLRFTTSSARPPLLGFKWLNPPFCIAKSSTEEGRLPSAATCMNLLKLPPYDSYEQLSEKLTYAVEAGAGFELS